MTTIDTLNPPDVLKAYRSRGSKPKRRNKYNARKCAADGYLFDSMVERDRYLYLVMLFDAEQIQRLRVHPRFDLLPRRKLKDGKIDRAVNFTPDFEYWQDGQRVVEDVKGKVTDAFTIRRKWFQSLHPDVEFRVVKRGKGGEDWEVRFYSPITPAHKAS